MRVFFSNIPEINNHLSLGNIVTVKVCQKIEDGYMLKLNDTEVFARSMLDLDIGDILKLQIVQSSPTQLAFKIVQREQANKPLTGHVTTLGFAETPETQGALRVLSKLNLPITKERMEIVLKLFSNITLHENPDTLIKTPTSSQSYNLIFHKFFSKLIHKNQSTDLNDALLQLLEDNPHAEGAEDTIGTLPQKSKPQLDTLKSYEIAQGETFKTKEGEISSKTYNAKELLSQEKPQLPQESTLIKSTIKLKDDKNSPFHPKKTDNNTPRESQSKKNTQYISRQAQGIILKQRSLQEQKNTNTLIKPFREEDIQESNKSKLKSEAVKEYIAIKALNSMYEDSNSESKICFFPINLPIYEKTYLKISKNSSNTSEDDSIKISFIVNTYNLGKVKVDLSYLHNLVRASVTFEQKEALELAKNTILGKKGLSELIKSLNLKMGTVSEKDFLFEKENTPAIPKGINIII